MKEDAQCPYCLADVEINHDDGYGYTEDLHNQECCECHNTFVFETAISFSYTTRKAPCFNGGLHEYEITHTYPLLAARTVCTACGEELS